MPKKIDPRVAYLKKNFANIGKASTQMSRWETSKENTEEFLKIKEYIERISMGGYLDRFETFLQRSRATLVAERLRQKTAKITLLEKASKGASNIFDFAVLPIWRSIVDLVYYRRRPRYNALKLGLSLLVLALVMTAAFAFAAMLGPAFTSIMAALGTFLSTSLIVVTSVMAFRVVFGLVGKILNKVYPQEQYFPSRPELSAWKSKTPLNEDDLKILKQYLINAEKQSQHPSIRFLIKSLRKNEFKAPSEGSLKKMAVFFVDQQRALKEEQRLHPEDKIVDLDIKAVDLILIRLLHCELLPGGEEGMGGVRAEIQAILSPSSKEAEPPVQETKPRKKQHGFNRRQFESTENQPGITQKYNTDTLSHPSPKPNKPGKPVS